MNLDIHVNYTKQEQNKKKKKITHLTYLTYVPMLKQFFNFKYFDRLKLVLRISFAVFPFLSLSFTHIAFHFDYCSPYILSINILGGKERNEHTNQCNLFKSYDQIKKNILIK